LRTTSAELRLHHRPEVRPDELGVLLDRVGQRHDERAFAHRHLRAHADGARGVEQELDAVGRAGRRRGQRVEVELAERRELPAGLALELGQRRRRTAVRRQACRRASRVRVSGAI
jgi:hypothetical protein